MDLELKKLGDLNALRYENFPFFWPSDSGKTGPMVPFHIKLLACLVPSLKEGGVKESISRLYQLLFECRKTRLRILRRKEKLEPVKWQSDLDVCRETQIKVQIANELYKLPDYVLALGVLESIHMADVREKALLDSLKGRLHLQLGDTGAAIRFFDQVEETLDNSVPKDAEILLTNKALLCICKGSWEMASTTLDELNTVAPSLISKANASLVHLYKGYAIEAVKTLEQVVFTNPEESARSSETLFNLSTLYDLLDQSPGRKKALLSQVISKQSGDTFKIECLKL